MPRYSCGWACPVWPPQSRTSVLSASPDRDVFSCRSALYTPTALGPAVAELRGIDIASCLLRVVVCLL